LLNVVSQNGSNGVGRVEVVGRPGERGCRCGCGRSVVKPVAAINCSEAAATPCKVKASAAATSDDAGAVGVVDLAAGGHGGARRRKNFEDAREGTARRARDPPVQPEREHLPPLILAHSDEIVARSRRVVTRRWRAPATLGQPKDLCSAAGRARRPAPRRPREPSCVPWQTRQTATVLSCLLVHYQADHRPRSQQG
jgi:hypothetical protein